ncbi:hypothetical protein OAD62_00410 [Oceanihabitans sp.]|nr:hypothetical protein [Oceanihabitans sp.]
MKKLVIIFFILIAYSSCKNDKKPVNNEVNIEQNAVVKNSKEKSILDIEYLNDTLDLRIEDFKIIHLKEDSYELEIDMATPKIETYANDHRFFVQFYYNDDIEVDKKNKLHLATNKVRVDGDKVIFSRKFTSQVDIFKTIRYGLANTKRKERYFTLKIDSITLVN